MRGGILLPHAIVVNATIVPAMGLPIPVVADSAFRQLARCRTSSSTNLLPKNASTSSAIAASVQRAATAPRQPQRQRPLSSPPKDRKSVVEGKRVSVRVDHGGGPNIKK